MPDAFKVEVSNGERVTASLYASRAKNAPAVVLAHGAGASQTSPFMVDMAEGLAERGIGVTTFDFVYTEKKRRAPDKPALLEACYRAVVRDVRVRKSGRALFIGGKSMGGRIASQIASGEKGFSGLVFLGYPLHPPGKLTQLRAKHLPGIESPMLFVQGSRDAFGTPEELRPVLAPLDAEIFTVDGGDHSFKVPKSMGTTHDAVMAAVMDKVAVWILARAK